MKRDAYVWIPLVLFAVSMIGHWLFGGFTFVDDARAHGQAVELTPYRMMMGRYTFENWPSEFLQLLWPVVGLAYLLYVGSPASRQNDDRTEAKLDALLQRVGKERGKAIIREIDKTNERRGVHATLHVDPPLNA